MSETRYQVFVSSTFIDLKLEREKTLQAILQLKAFPAGMELFPAADQEQFEFIKREIRSSDYYVLIIAGRYGSLANDGLSFTEKEYDYAISEGKPVLAFLYKDVKDLPGERTEAHDIGRKKLNAFRIKAQKSRLVNYFSNADELKSQVLLALSSEFVQTPTRGWVRADRPKASGADMTWEEFFAQCERLKQMLKEKYDEKKYEPDLILAITNGGLIFAEIMVYRLFNQKPLLSLWANRFNDGELFDNTYNLGVVGAIKKMVTKSKLEILLLDDNVASSGTFHQARRFLHGRLPQASISYLPVFTRNPQFIDLIGKENFIWSRAEFASPPIDVKALHLTERRFFPYGKDIAAP